MDIPRVEGQQTRRWELPRAFLWTQIFFSLCCLQISPWWQFVVGRLIRTCVCCVCVGRGGGRKNTQVNTEVLNQRFWESKYFTTKLWPWDGQRRTRRFVAGRRERAAEHAGEFASLGNVKAMTYRPCERSANRCLLPRVQVRWKAKQTQAWNRSVPVEAPAAGVIPITRVLAGLTEKTPANEGTRDFVEAARGPACVRKSKTNGALAVCLSRPISEGCMSLIKSLITMTTGQIAA